MVIRTFVNVARWLRLHARALVLRSGCVYHAVAVGWIPVHRFYRLLIYACGCSDLRRLRGCRFPHRLRLRYTRTVYPDLTGSGCYATLLVCCGLPRCYTTHLRLPVWVHVWLLPRLRYTHTRHAHLPAAHTRLFPVLPTHHTVYVRWIYWLRGLHHVDSRWLDAFDFTRTFTRGYVYPGCPHAHTFYVYVSLCRVYAVRYLRLVTIPCPARFTRLVTVTRSLHTLRFVTLRCRLPTLRLVYVCCWVTRLVGWLGSHGLHTRFTAPGWVTGYPLHTTVCVPCCSTHRGWLVYLHFACTLVLTAHHTAVPVYVTVWFPVHTRLPRYPFFTRCVIHTLPTAYTCVLYARTPRLPGCCCVAVVRFGSPHGLVWVRLRLLHTRLRCCGYGYGYVGYGSPRFYRTRLRFTHYTVYGSGSVVTGLLQLVVPTRLRTDCWLCIRGCSVTVYHVTVAPSHLPFISRLRCATHAYGLRWLRTRIPFATLPRFQLPPRYILHTTPPDGWFYLATFTGLHTVLFTVYTPHLVAVYHICGYYITAFTRFLAFTLRYRLRFGWLYGCLPYHTLP